MRPKLTWPFLRRYQSLRLSRHRRIAKLHFMELQYSAPKQLTLDEYECLIEPDDYRSELSKGWLVREPRPGWLHQEIARRVYDRVKPFVSEHGLGAVYFEVGYRLSDNPLVIRGADVSFITAARMPA